MLTPLQVALMFQRLLGFWIDDREVEKLVRKGQLRGHTNSKGELLIERDSVELLIDRLATRRRRRKRIVLASLLLILTIVFVRVEQTIGLREVAVALDLMEPVIVQEPYPAEPLVIVEKPDEEEIEIDAEFVGMSAINFMTKTAYPINCPACKVKLSWSPDGYSLAFVAGSTPSYVRPFSFQSVNSFEEPASARYVGWAADGKSFYAVGRGGEVVLMQPDPAQSRRTSVRYETNLLEHKPANAFLSAMSVSPDGRYMAVGWDHDHRLEEAFWSIIDTANWNAITEEITEHRIIDLAWSPQGDMLALMRSDDKGTLIWHLPTRTMVAFAPLYKPPLAWSHNGRFIAGGALNGINIWDLWAECTATHIQDNSSSATWSPGRALLATPKAVYDLEGNVLIRFRSDANTRAVAWSVQDFLAMVSGKQLFTWNIPFPIDSNIGLVEKSCGAGAPAQMDPETLARVQNVSQQVQSGEMTREQAQAELDNLAGEIGLAGLEWIVRRVPIYDAEQGRLTNTEDYLKGLVRELNPEESPDYRAATDPVGTGLDAMFGEYSSSEELMDWFGIESP